MGTPRLLSSEVTSGPDVEPVTLADVKKQLEIELSETDHDSFLNGLLIGARESVEAASGYALITQTVQLRFEYCGEREWPLLVPPVQTVTSIKTRYEGTETDEDENDFFLTSGLVPSYRMKSSADAGFSADDVDEVEITYVAGFGDNAGDVPEALKLAIKQLAAERFEYRVSRELGTVVSSLHEPGSWIHTIRSAGLVIPSV